MGDDPYDYDDTHSGFGNSGRDGNRDEWRSNEDTNFSAHGCGATELYDVRTERGERLAGAIPNSKRDGDANGRVYGDSHPEPAHGATYRRDGEFFAGKRYVEWKRRDFSVDANGSQQCNDWNGNSDAIGELRWIDANSYDRSDDGASSGLLAVTFEQRDDECG